MIKLPQERTFNRINQFLWVSIVGNLLSGTKIGHNVGNARFKKMLHVFNDIRVRGMVCKHGFCGIWFSHSGNAGIIIYSAFWGLIIALVESYGRSMGHNIAVATPFQSILTIFRSSDLTTVLLTLGLVCLFLVYCIVPQIVRTPK